jgi:hypothetical protein
VELAHRIWANEILPSEVTRVLTSPAHFEQASALVTKEATRALFPAGPDPQAHLAAIEKYRQAGYDELYVANIGPNWPGFFDFYATEVLPATRR